MFKLLYRRAVALEECEQKYKTVLSTVLCNTQEVMCYCVTLTCLFICDRRITPRKLCESKRNIYVGTRIFKIFGGTAASVHHSHK